MYEQVFIFTTEGGLVDVFRIDSEGKWVENLEKAPLPEWTLLKDDMCPDCIYKREGHVYCKGAIGLYSAVNSFSNIKSITRVTLTTITSKGNVISRCATAPEGLSILFLSCLVFSGCYRFAQFKWAWDYYRMQQNHVDMFFTLFSSFVTREFIRNEAPDRLLVGTNVIDEFIIIYRSLKTIVKRVRKASKEDANLNALVRLTNMAHIFQMNYEEYIENFRDAILSEQ